MAEWSILQTSTNSHGFMSEKYNVKISLYDKMLLIFNVL